METDVDVTAAVETAKKAAKSAHRAMVLTAFAVAVAVAVLAIDNSIKRSIVSEAQDVRKIFDDFKRQTDGLTAAIQGTAGDSPSDSAPDHDASDLAEPPRAPAATDNDAGPGKSPRPAGKSGTRTRP